MPSLTAIVVLFVKLKKLWKLVDTKSLTVAASQAAAQLPVAATADVATKVSSPVCSAACTTKNPAVAIAAADQLVADATLVLPVLLLLLKKPLLKLHQLLLLHLLLKLTSQLESVATSLPKRLHAATDSLGCSA